MKRLFILILAVLFFTSNANAQLLGEGVLYPNVERDFYHNVKTLKTKSYSGTGGRGFWRIAKYDAMGRVVEKEYYRKRKLLSRQNFGYNSNNDILYEITTFDINNPNRINDTIYFYEYKYQEDKIIYQKLTFFRSHDTIVMRLIENKTDTTLIYQKKSCYFRPRTNVTDIYEEKHTLNYKNGLLVSFEKIDENSRETTFLEYYSNRKLKRKKTEREPEEEFITVGGPGGDDMIYEYKFDIFGRIKKLYYIIGEKKYKIATYEYRK